MCVYLYHIGTIAMLPNSLGEDAANEQCGKFNVRIYNVYIIIMSIGMYEWTRVTMATCNLMSLCCILSQT